MKKQNVILIPFLAIVVVFLIGYQGFGWNKIGKNNNNKVNEIIKIIDIPLITQPNQSKVQLDAWQVFQTFLEFARTHNLNGIKNLSHQISKTCNDPSMESECFALMDNVYTIGSSMKAGDFKNVLSDNRQIILYTDAPSVAILYFTKNDASVVKILGLRFCYEEESSLQKCVEPDQVKQDSNNNGWWDSVESLFY